MLAKLQTIDIDSEVVEEYAGDAEALVVDVVEQIEGLVVEADGSFETIGESDEE